MSKHLDLTKDENRPHNGLYLAGCPVCAFLDKLYREELKKAKGKRRDYPGEERE